MAIRPAVQAPTLSDFSKSGFVNVPVVFSATDFTSNFTDPDMIGTLQDVKIVTLPSAASGTLELNGIDVSAGQVIPEAQLGNLTFVPLQVGSPSFQWNATDGHLYSANNATVTLNIAFGLPTVTSPTATKITSTIATLGGDVTADGGAPITKRGVVYALTSVNPNPQLGGPGVFEVDDPAHTTGVFADNITGLTPNSGYSFAAFATNSQGPAYSPTSTFMTTILGPASSITGPTTGRPGQTLTFTLNGFDPAPGMQLFGFVFHIKWGDGKTDTVTGLNGTTINHAYANPGTYVIQVSAVDGRSTILPTGTLTVIISRTSSPGVVTPAVATGGNTTNVLAVSTNLSAPTAAKSLAVNSSSAASNATPTIGTIVDALMSGASGGGLAHDSSESIPSSLVLNSLANGEGELHVDALFADSDGIMSFGTTVSGKRAS